MCLQNSEGNSTYSNMLKNVPCPQIHSKRARSERRVNLKNVFFFISIMCYKIEDVFFASRSTFNQLI